MPNMTLHIPEDVHKRMQEFGWVSWSHVAREAIIQRMARLEEMEQIMSKSKLTQEDVDEISASIKKGIGKRFREELSRTQTS